MPIGLNKTEQGKKLYAELVESIGNKAAEKFTEAFAARSRNFYVSNCLKAKIRLRNMMIKKDFDEITNGGIPSPRAVNNLAVKYGLSARARPKNACRLVRRKRHRTRSIRRPFFNTTGYTVSAA